MLYISDLVSSSLKRILVADYTITFFYWGILKTTCGYSRQITENKKNGLMLRNFTTWKNKMWNVLKPGIELTQEG